MTTITRFSFAISLILVLLCTTVSCSRVSEPPEKSPEPTSAPTSAPSASAMPHEYSLRGVWVASVFNLDYPSRKKLTEHQLKQEADKILDNAVRLGFNAVFFQVRPEGDALYKSEIFPQSQYLAGKQGNVPPGGFDPLDYFIKGAHSRGLQLHAWINPYRISRTKKDWKKASKNSPAKQNPDWVLKAGKLRVYNPGIPEVLDLVLSGVREILENYEVDGIHYDDYFYPEDGRCDFEKGQLYDFETFVKYSEYDPEENGLSPADSEYLMADWRRENVNTLIRKTQKLVHTLRPECQFGVSPRGIWDNKSKNTRGSNTAGKSSYRSDFADSRRWVKMGWVDYIAPQIYWEIGRKEADYATLLDWWSNVVDNTGVKLYIGHATWLSSQYGANETWKNGREIKRQVELIKADSQATGSIHFRYAEIIKNPRLCKTLKKLNNAAE